nr:hypothetical protein HK105_007222 [Polyrhizophydium stewartii]
MPALWSEQDTEQDRLLADRERFIAELRTRQTEIDGQEILGKMDARQVAAAEAQLHEELRAFDMRMFDRMESLRRRQQDAMRKLY